MHNLMPLEGAELGEQLTSPAPLDAVRSNAHMVDFDPEARLADILSVPDLESGNMLAKQREDMGGAQCSGIVLGARVPIALTSRSDGVAARPAFAGLVPYLAHWHEQHRP
jgi:hypothetical protein